MATNNIVIIGAGPAGISAAIQLRRYDIEVTVLEKNAIGGLLRNANLVENYPGFPKGISGRRLVELFRKQLEREGINIYFEEVVDVDYKNKLFVVNTDKRTITRSKLVIATGTKPIVLSDIDISADARKRIFYEIDHLIGITGNNITIIGSGDVAFDYALNLSKKNRVLILNRGHSVKCLPLLWRRASKSKRISYLEDTYIKKIRYDNHGLLLSCYSRGDMIDIYTSYLIVAIGRKPYLDFISDNLKNKIEELQETKQLYLIGDVKNNIYRQTAIAVGDGIKAAMEIHREMAEGCLWK